MRLPCCDRCQRDIDPTIDLHYSLTIELEAGGFGDESDVATELEQLDDLEQLIESSDARCSADFAEDLYQRKQYELCRACFQQYIQNPLAKDRQSTFGYNAR